MKQPPVHNQPAKSPQAQVGHKTNLQVWMKSHLAYFNFLSKRKVTISICGAIFVFRSMFQLFIILII